MIDFDALLNMRHEAIDEAGLYRAPQPMTPYQVARMWERVACKGERLDRYRSELKRARKRGAVKSARHYRRLLAG